MRWLIDRIIHAPSAGLVLIGLTMAALAMGQGGIAAFDNDFSGLGFQILTGVALLTGLCHQWVFFAKRVLRSNRNIRQHQTAHRWVGVAVTLLFALHAVRFGHVWMSALSVLFFQVALTGVLNRSTLGYRSQTLYRLWLCCHIGLSAAMIPLIGVHIWVALAYQ